MNNQHERPYRSPDRENLIHRFIDGVLSSEETAALLDRVKEDEQWRAELADALQLDEQLAWLEYDGVRAFTPQELNAFTAAERRLDSAAAAMDGSDRSPTAPKARRPVKLWAAIWTAAALAACLLLAASFLLPTGSVAEVASHDEATEQAATESGLTGDAVATITRVISSDLQHGGRETSTPLTEGQVIEFAQGVAEIRFHSGVDLIVTGPAKLRVEGPMAATLSYGRATANVKDSAIGFRLDTLDASVIDLGTVFGIDAPRDGPSQVEVYSGQVDVSSRLAPGEKLRLVEGESATIRQRKVVVIEPGATGRFLLRSLDRPSRRLEASHDAYIEGGVGRNQVTGEEPLLLVKRDNLVADYNRRSYLQFDLSELDRSRIVAARLTLTTCPNDIAETKHPENEVAEVAWKFQVGGLWDSERDWSEHHLAWNNAPGHDASSITGEVFGPEAPYLVGNFGIQAHGTYGWQVSISGPELLRFLLSDRDGHVSFVVSRQTGYTYSASRVNAEDRVVHSFASKEHGRLPPPLLEIWSE